MHVTDLPKLLTPKQFCELTNVDEQTAANWRCTKKSGPPFIRLSKRAVRYSREAVLAWLEKQTVVTSAH